jgi:hypothetical protein
MFQGQLNPTYQFLLAKEEAHCLSSPQRKWILKIVTVTLAPKKKYLLKNFGYFRRII